MIRTIILEDEYLVRVGLKTVIEWEKEGYILVGEGMDGLEGLNLYETLKPDLIVTDIGMPKLDGLEMMKKIRERDTEVQFVILSAYDDFNFAKEAISLGVKYYCLKGTMMDTEFVAVLRKIKKEIKCKVNYVPIEEVMTCFNESYAVYVLCTFNEEDFNNEIFIKQAIHFVQTIDGDESYTVIGLKEEQILKKVVQDLGQYTVGISEKVKDNDSIKKAIQQAFLASRQVFFQQNTRINFYDASLENQSLYICDKDLEQFYHALVISNYNQAREYLKCIERAVQQSKSVRLLCRVIYRLVGMMGEYDIEVIEGHLYKKFLAQKELSYIFQKILEWIDREETKQEPVIEKKNVYILQIKEYVARHYERNIKVKDLAEAIHLSTSYIGKLFYAETEMYLKDYITKVKLEKARELLKKGDLTVNQVANKVGIEDANYFSKLFKKQYGQPPSHYIKIK